MAADMKYDNLKFSWQNEKNSLLKMLKKLQKSSSKRTKTVQLIKFKNRDYFSITLVCFCKSKN